MTNPNLPFMKSFILAALLVPSFVFAELRVPAFTAYVDPDPNGVQVDKSGVKNWKDNKQKVSWFGEFKQAGKLDVSLEVKSPGDGASTLKLTVGGQTHKAQTKGSDHTRISFGTFEIKEPGYQRIELASGAPAGKAVSELETLVLDGSAVQDAHFNLLPRRNAASVHLTYPTEKDAKIAAFYCEVTGVEDPVATYYMACGFSRGYFGMQVNSATERRIIFSVWDSGAGQGAKDRSSVSKEDQTQLLGKGEGVEAGVFGNEGTGGHSHLVYNWKTGEKQRFLVTAKADGTHTTYSGYWFHPEHAKWMLIASFRAPKDGNWLRGLYSFSENFGGNNGHLLRKALYGNQWIRLENGEWKEITTAKFSHDGTGKADRLDRFMGVERGQFFLSHGGFVPGFTKFGEPFDRPATGKSPVMDLPKITE